MIPSLIILSALVVVGAILYLHHRLTSSPADVQADATPAAQAPEHEEQATETEGECCGLHEVCEKFPPAPERPIYYDDEELDAFAGRPPHDYTEAETEMFRDVLETLLPADVYGWTQSIEQRGIQLPSCMRDEVLMRLADRS